MATNVPDSDMNLTIGVVIVNWNTRDCLERCVASFIDDGVSDNCIIVVDTGSTDGSIENLGARFPSVRTAHSAKNSYSAAINLGAMLLACDLLVISNADVVVHSGTIRKMRAAFCEDDRLGIAGCTIVDGDGRDATRKSRLGYLRAAALFLTPRFFHGSIRDLESVSITAATDLDVRFIEGAFFMVRRAVFESIGGMDEHFVFFFEDADVSLRIRKAGYFARLFTAARVTHLGNQSFARLPASRLEHLAVSLLHFYERHHPRQSATAHRMLRFALGARAMIERVHALVDGSMDCCDQRYAAARDTVKKFTEARAVRIEQLNERRPAGFLSVVIPTRNRIACLQTLLPSIERQSFQNFELLVIDQSDTPMTAALFDAVCSNTFLSRIRFTHLTRANRSHAKNVALRHARSDIVLFLDDDQIAPPDLFEAHVAMYDDPTIGGVSCRTIERNAPLISSTDICRVTWYGRMIAGYQSDVSADVETLVGGNMSMRAPLAKYAGEFEELFIGTSIFEEQDFSHRLRALGYRIRFTNRTTAEHFPQDSGNLGDIRKKPAEYYRAFHHNESLFFLKNRPLYQFPFMLSFCFARSVKQCIVHRLPAKDIGQMFAGVFDGWRTYRNYR